jgi:subtilisin family serine protease
VTRRSRIFTRVLSILALSSFLTPPTPATAQPPHVAVLDTGYVIVKFRHGVTRGDKTAHHASVNASVFKEIRELDIDVIQIPDPAATRAVAAAYLRSPKVEYAEPDALMPLADASFVTPDDPLLGNQWHHVNIESQNAWAFATGLPMPITRITVCDTGVSSTHPDLQASLRTDLGYNTADNAPGHWEPVHWHGTAVAGSAAAIGNNALGVAGVSLGSEIVPVRVTNLLSGSAYISDMADCINYGANVGSDVINLSYQTYSGGAIFSTIIAAADYADSLGSVVVIAAGNENSNQAPNQDPASIVYAAATTSTNGKASFSNYGNYVDIAAPGESITTTYATVNCSDANHNGLADPGECVVSSNGYASVSGTSFASPITAGGVLLVRSLDPTLSAAATRSILFQSATDLGTAGEDTTYGAGLLNVHAAVHLAEPPPSSTLTVTAPNGVGESWAAGSTQTIRWSSSGVSGNIRIDLSRDGGATWTTLFASVANSGSKSWRVSGPVTTNALVRITSLNTPSVSDVSNAPFTIRR